MTGPTAPRRYKGFTPTAGVYRILHLPSGRTLLGASPHAQGMLNRLRFQFTLGSFPGKTLQGDWNADGEAAFRFEILDVLAPDANGEVGDADLAELLNLWEERLALPAGQRYGAKGA
ncbi:GIY-YIG nuclease family protein [Deinococcus apachensis]|uniref:GIY-YIG nuclease family protein n=1 Tax=Deinococcus apachensis TaxID=309886 RepID=UPI00036ABEB9|nr:GIY-YIG nuclease family protein [Deinococcus apachensis]